MFRCDHHPMKMRLKSVHLWLFIIIISIFFIFTKGHKQEFCSRTTECLSKVRKLVAQTDRFWFGDNWRLTCGGFAAARLREVSVLKGWR